MRRLFVSLSLAVTLLSGCNLLRNSNVSNSNNGNTNSEPSYANRAKPKGDFSNPKAAVQTFISAGTNKDADLLSRCFHPDSPGEFRNLRTKTSTAKELDDLASFVEGATVGEAEEKGDNALVKVAFKKRNEEMTMKKLEGEWKILDF